MDRAFNRHARASLPHQPRTAYPLTPAMTRALAARLATGGWVTRIVLGIATALCVGTGAVAIIISPHDFILGVFVIACGAPLVWFGDLLTRRMARSVQGGVFYRAEGPLKLDGGEVPIVCVGDVRITSYEFGSFKNARTIKRLPYGVVDYMDGGVGVIEIRDLSGQVQYRMSGYAP